MIDVYNGDGEIDWARVRAAGHAGGIVKATEGIDMVDARLAENLAGMKAAGMVRGAYHFLRVQQNPARQALHLLNALQAAGYDYASDLPPALDLEDAGAGDCGREIVTLRVAAFLKIVEGRTGRRCILYTGKYWANDYLGDAFAGHPLWLAGYPAHYTETMQPDLPSGWTDWAIWQYTSTGTVPGVPSVGNTDVDRFNGDEEKLRHWAATGVLTSKEIASDS
jgi:lysozyme